MTAGDVVLAAVIGVLVAVPCAFLLALLLVSWERREPIPWREMWRALTQRGR